MARGWGERQAGNRAIDFLVLIPTGMDAVRNERQQNELLAAFVGNPQWRDGRAAEPTRYFGNFFVEEFARSMNRIGYQWAGLQSASVIRNQTNSPIYHLVFFSRSARGLDFWKKCKQSTTSQKSLPF